ncbi:MAG: lamin tail domain-containing protein, partial [Planctomycetaceae bacterium]
MNVIQVLRVFRGFTARVAPSLVVSTLLVLIVSLVAFAPRASGSLLITEINSNGTGGDFFEVYNSGASAVDLSGWRWSDYDVRNWA